MRRAGSILSAALVLIGIVSISLMPASASAGTRAVDDFVGIYLAGFQGIVKTPGIVLFSSLSGRQVGRLTANPGDLSPQVADDGRFVYFLRSNPTCVWTAWRVPTTGGVATLVRRGMSATVMAVSRDGRMLAYETSHSGCRGVGPETLTVVDLASGQHYSIANAVSIQSMAWAPDDRSLVVGVLSSPYDEVEAYVLHPLMAAHSAKLGRPLPCPLGAAHCAEYTVEYDAAGDLFYVSVVDPDPRRPCSLSVCSTQTYVLTELKGESTIPLARSIGRAGLVAWSTVNAAGTAAIFTVPHAHRTWETFRWNDAGTVPLPSRVQQESW